MDKNNIKKLGAVLAVLLLACLMIAGAGAAEEDNSVYEDSITYTVNPDANDNASDSYGRVMSITVNPVTLQEVNSNEGMVFAGLFGSSESLPEKYDLRNVDGKTYLTSVKNQGAYGTCWSFGIMGAIESAILKKYSDVSADTLDLSELQLIYYVGNRTGVTKGTSLEGFESITPAYYDVDFYAWEGGGFIPQYTAKQLTSGIGVATEDTAEFKYSYIDSVFGEQTKTYEPELAVSENEYYIVGTTSVNITERDEIKKLIMEKGAAQVSYYGDGELGTRVKGHYEGGTFVGDTKCYDNYFQNAQTTINHAVVLVGWDDNYPAENFANYKLNTDGTTVKSTLSQPTSNGAWLIKNSWGEWTYTDYDGKEKTWDGYMWISYEDPSLNCIEFYDVIRGDEIEELYDTIYQYDGGFATGWRWSGNTYGIGQTQTAAVESVYTANGNEKLTAVQFSTMNTNIAYTIDIWVNEEKICSKSGTETYIGDYTVNLEDSDFINGFDGYVRKDDCIEVVIRLSMETQNEGDHLYVVYDFKGGDFITVTGVTGRSYYRFEDGDWYDFGYISNAGSARMKLYTVDAYQVSFSGDTYGTVTAEAGGSSITSGNIVEKGSTVVFTVTPNEGYQLSTFTVNGVDKKSEVSSGTYTISGLSADTTVTATFEPIRYTITIAKNQDEWGTVSQATVTNVPYGTTWSVDSDNKLKIGSIVDITATPATATAQYTYGFDGWDAAAGTVTEDTTITANFTQTTNEYTVTLNTSTGISGFKYTIEGGSETVYSEPFPVSYGKTVRLEAVLEEGYAFTQWESGKTQNPYTTGPVTGALTFTPTAALKKYMVTFSGDTHGTVTAKAGGETISSGIEVNALSTVVFTITPADGYQLSTFTVNGVDKKSEVSSGTYTISSLSADTTVSATFEIIKYAVNFSGDAHGTVTAKVGESSLTSGNPVAHGSTVVFTITPNEGYQLSTFTVNGVDKKSEVSSGTYIISSLSADTTVEATFEIIKYAVNFSGDAHGTVTAKVGESSLTSGNPVAHGSTVVFTITPNEGYQLSTFTVNGVDKKSEVSSGTYTISSLSADTTVEATFEIIKYAVNFSGDTHGTVTAKAGGETISSGAEVNALSTVVFTITPNDGYQLSTFTVNGSDKKSEASSGTYTIISLSADTTVAATFDVVKYTITIAKNQDGWGTVSHETVTDVPYGTTWSVDSDNKLKIGTLAEVTATPAEATAQYTYGFDGWAAASGTVTGDTTITANFTRTTNEYTITIAKNQDEWGTVSQATVPNVPYGTAWSVDSDNKLKIGSIADITATPATATAQYTYGFDGWDAAAGTVTGDTTITANFTQTTNEYTVTLNTSAGISGFKYTIEGGSETVYTNPFPVSYGKTVTLEAVLEEGYAFTQWESGKTQNPYTAGPVTGALTFTPTAALKKYTVSFSGDTHGTVTAKAGGETISSGAEVNALSTVVFTITPNDGYQLSTFTVNGSDKKSEASSGTYTIISLSADTTVAATFDVVKYTITIAKNQDGWGTVSHETVTDVPYGTTWSVDSDNKLKIGTLAEVTATPAEATAQYTYGFDGWTAASGTVTGDTTITANFTRTTNEYTITIAKNQDEWGTVSQATVTNVPYGTAWGVDSDKKLKIGSIADITATPATATAQYTYGFDGWDAAAGTVTGDTTITANFTQTISEYTITIAKNENGWGTVSRETVTNVPYGTAWSVDSDKILSIDGIAEVTATPATATAEYTYGFDGWTAASGTVTGDTTITANFTQTTNKYTVTIAKNENDWGTVSRATVTEVPYGTAWSVDSGNKLKIGTLAEVTATPATATAQYTYGFDGWDAAAGTVTEDTTITANFTQTTNEYTVTLNTSTGISGFKYTIEGGSETVYTNPFPVSYGKTVRLEAVLEEGYAFTQWESGKTQNPYTAGPVTGALTFTPTAALKEYTVSFSGDANGSVTALAGASSLNSGDSVTHGSTVVFTVTPNEGYLLSTFTVNGSDKKSEVSSGTYTISSLSADTTVSATFEIIKYAVNFSGDTHGTVTAKVGSESLTSGTNVAIGSSVVFTVTPDEGYLLSTFTVNGSDKKSEVSSGTYTISSLSADTTVSATFEIIKYAVSFSGDANGSVTAKVGSESLTSGNPVSHGSTVVFTVTPNEGYRLSTFTVNGSDKKSEVSSGTYTISSLSADTTVSATFEIIKYTVTFDANGGEGIMDSQVFTYGISQNLNKNLFTRGGYKFGGWSVGPETTLAYGDEAEYLATEDTTLYAYWLKNTDVITDVPAGTDTRVEVETSEESGSVSSVTFNGYTDGLKLIYKKTSEAGTTEPTGTVVSKFDMNVLDKDGYEVTSGVSADISFLVDKSEISGSLGSVRLAHWINDAEWNYLPTTYEDQGTKYEFDASVDGFSPFAIVILSEEPVSSAIRSSSVTSFAGEKSGNDFLFSNATVVTKATLPGATSAKITNTSGSGWYNFSLTADGFKGNGVLCFQVPTDVIATKGYTVNDVSLIGTATTYLTTANGYAKYSAIITRDGSYTVDFETDAAANAVTETKPVTETPKTQEPTKVADTPVTTTPVTTETPVSAAKTPFPVLGILAGLGAAAFFLRRR